MDTYEFKPTEDFSLGKVTEGGEAVALETATFEPATFMEETGEVQPAEVLQVSLESVVASLSTDVPLGRPGDTPELMWLPGPDEGTQETEIKDIPGIGTVPGMHDAETMVREVPPREEQVPLHADMADAVTKPPSEVIVEGGLPMGSVPGDESTGESEPAASDDAREWGATSTPTVRAEAGAETAIPTELPRGEAVIPPILPGREAGRAIPGAGGAGEAPLPESGRVEYEEQPERLDARLPEAQKPLAGLEAKEFTGVAPGKGTGGLSGDSESDMIPGSIRYGGKPGGGQTGSQGDGSESGLPGVPFDLPDIDEMVGIGAGKAGGPRVVGNIPGKGGKLGDHTGMSDFGFPDMPTSGGYSSSGSGPAMIGGRGSIADGEDSKKTTDGSTDTGAEEEGKKGKKGKSKTTNYETERDSKKACDNTAQSLSESATGNFTLDCQVGERIYGYTGGKGWYTWDRTQYGASSPSRWKSQEPEGDSNPHPYTGGSMGPATPEKDNDTGKVLPDADLNGFDLPVWSADPDSVDDSGRFYGGIFGGGRVYPDSGGARPIDPVRKTEDEAEAAEDVG